MGKLKSQSIMLSLNDKLYNFMNAHTKPHGFLSCFNEEYRLFLRVLFDEFMPPFDACEVFSIGAILQQMADVAAANPPKLFCGDIKRAKLLHDLLVKLMYRRIGRSDLGVVWEFEAIAGINSAELYALQRRMLDCLMRCMYLIN